jgi:hypothetical protein
MVFMVVASEFEQERTEETENHKVSALLSLFAPVESAASSIGSRQDKAANTASQFQLMGVDEQQKVTEITEAKKEHSVSSVPSC